MVAQALRDVGQFESFWLGGKPEESASTGKGWAKLTPEQLDYIATTGQLPPGVSDDALFGVGLETGRKN
jgi:hypothetical protein